MSAEKDVNEQAAEGVEPSADVLERELRIEINLITRQFIQNTYAYPLDMAEQLWQRMFLKVAAIIRRRREAGRRVTELRGLGKSVWQGVDAQAYVDAERESWRG